MITIPYGKGHLTYDAPCGALLTSRIEELHSEKSGAQLVREAMASPIGSERLEKLAVLLDSEAELLQTEALVHQKVREQIDEHDELMAETLYEVTLLEIGLEE